MVYVSVYRKKNRISYGKEQQVVKYTPKVPGSYMYICIYVYMYICIYVQMYICTDVQMYRCTDVHVYVYVYVHG